MGQNPNFYQKFVLEASIIYILKPMMEIDVAFVVQDGGDVTVRLLLNLCMFN